MRRSISPNRRTFLRQSGFGLGPLALSWMLDRREAFVDLAKSQTPERMALDSYCQTLVGANGFLYAD